MCSKALKRYAYPVTTRRVFLESGAKLIYFTSLSNFITNIVENLY